MSSNSLLVLETYGCFNASTCINCFHLTWNILDFQLSAINYGFLFDLFKFQHNLRSNCTFLNFPKLFLTFYQSSYPQLSFCSQFFCWLGWHCRCQLGLFFLLIFHKKIEQKNPQWTLCRQLSKVFEFLRIFSEKETNLFREAFFSNKSFLWLSFRFLFSCLLITLSQFLDLVKLTCFHFKVIIYGSTSTTGSFSFWLEKRVFSSKWNRCLN